MGAASTGGGTGPGAASAVMPCTTSATGTGGSGEDASGTTLFNALAAVSRDSGTLGGSAANCCTMSKHGTPGLGWAEACPHHNSSGQTTLAVTTVVTPMRFMVGDMVFP